MPITDLKSYWRWN